MKTIKAFLFAFILLLNTHSVSAWAHPTPSSATFEKEDLAWGNEPMTFISKNQSGFGRLIEAIPTREGQEMTFIHYDVSPDSIIYKFTIRGAKLKRSPFAWLFNEPSSYAYQTNGPDGRVLSIASYSLETESLVISPYKSKGRNQAHFEYVQVDSETLDHLKVIAALPDAATDGRALILLGR